MSQTVTLALRAPLEIDGVEVRALTLREPTGSDLRGILLANLVQGSVAAHAALIPRIATPAPTAAQIERAPMADHLAIMQALQGFFGAGPATPDDAA